MTMAPLDITVDQHPECQKLEAPSFHRPSRAVDARFYQMAPSYSLVMDRVLYILNQSRGLETLRFVSSTYVGGSRLT